MTARLFRLIRSTPGSAPAAQVTGIVAEAAVFSDGLSILHWLTPPQGTEIYSTEQQISGVTIVPAPSDDAALPLADDDSEAQADAAQQRADLAERAETWRDRDCPDDGTCHHYCTVGCWRVMHAEPLSAAGWGDQWPEEIRRANEQSDGVL